MLLVKWRLAARLYTRLEATPSLRACSRASAPGFAADAAAPF